MRLVYGVVIIAGILFTFFHMIHWADSVARYTNYFISLAIVPSVFGLIVGSLGGIILEKGISKGIKNNWKIKVTGILASLAPVIYYICLMSFVSN